MSTPLEVMQEGVHMKGLEKSKNAKECGDLTVLPLGYLSSIHKDQTLELLQALHDELEGKKEPAPPQNYVEAVGMILTDLEIGYNQAIKDQQDNLQALMDKYKYECLCQRSCPLYDVQHASE